MNPQIHRLSIVGMQCVDCANVVEEAVLMLPGIINAKANFTNDSLTLKLDSDVIGINTVSAAITQAGYGSQPYHEIKSQGLVKKIAIILIALIGIFLLVGVESYVDSDILMPEMGANASYGMIFLIGFLTSFHCIGMCGGLVVSYAVGTAQSRIPAIFRHINYGIGKTLSYTLFGALFGWLGGAITITLGMRSVASGVAGGFLIIYGLSVMKAFSGLRRFHIRLPGFLVRALAEKRRNTTHPMMIGLLNGLMLACGPLQAMYVMAAGTGNPVEGAKLLALFAIGTLPVMFAFGSMASMITAQSTKKMLQASGVIIILLGVIMLNRSLIMTGAGYDIKSLTSKATQQLQTYFTGVQKTQLASAQLQNNYQVVYMEVGPERYSPAEFTLYQDIPIKWIIDVKELTRCNQQLVIPAINKTINLQPGLQLIEFTPEQKGTMHWSCSMGMMQGKFTILDNKDRAEPGQ